MKKRIGSFAYRLTRRQLAIELRAHRKAARDHSLTRSDSGPTTSTLSPPKPSRFGVHSS